MILITGARGTTGGEVARQLIAAGVRHAPTSLESCVRRDEAAFR